MRVSLTVWSYTAALKRKPQKQKLAFLQIRNDGYQSVHSISHLHYYSACVGYIGILWSKCASSSLFLELQFLAWNCDTHGGI